MPSRERILSIPEPWMDARFQSEGRLIDWSRCVSGHIWYNLTDVTADLH